MLHALKTETGYFSEIKSGVKTFEVRRFDRPFQTNDDIVLQEYDPTHKVYTGDEWYGKITHILDNERFCKKGFCILSIKPKENDY
jgi:hypothetical protein